MLIDVILNRIFATIMWALFVGFLPSSFSMYAISLSSALFLFEKPAMAVAVAAFGVILGWPFSVLAFLPITIYSLIRRFKQTFLAGAFTSIVLLVSQLFSKFSPSLLPMLLQYTLEVSQVLLVLQIT